MLPWIIIPAFNENDELRKTVENARQTGFPVVVVDDGSPAEQETFLHGLNVHVLRHPLNLGQGAALQTGMDYARLHGAQAVIHFDADGQHDIQDIPTLLNALENGADAALGSRFLRQKDTELVPKSRRFMLRIARIVNGIFTGLWLTDAHNGFRALGPRALQLIDLHENRMAHATEILAQLKQHHLKVTEVPVTVRYTDYSKAKGQKWTNAINIIIDLILGRFF